MNNLRVQYTEGRFNEFEELRIAEALEFAQDAHTGQKRVSGEDFFVHPFSVAQILADWGLDAETVMAALMHDTVEDTAVTVEDIQKRFGDKVAELVDGVTKLGMVEAVPEDSLRQDASNENLRKLLLAMSRDIRVIIIKLADRLHNLQTLKYLPPAKQRLVAQESLEVFAPLADRLGMGQLKADIEDLSFRYTQPETFAEVDKLVTGYVKRSSRYIVKLKRFIKDELNATGIEVLAIEGRQKHLYSVYKKLVKADGDIDKIYDLIAVRVIVPDVSNCYQAMGILHQYFKPLIGRIKDYIALPKPNGYRSLHTTVFAIDGRISEIQIRTPEMHAEAEKGLAAHFYYDEQKKSKGYSQGRAAVLPNKLSWVSGLSDLSSLVASGQEFVEAVKLDLFQDRIFVLSPKGDVYDLPGRSTPVDFAFAIHSDLGLRIQGAKVNGRIVPIDTQLENRDMVKILARKLPNANRDWLTFVRTPQAKNRIRAWFRAVGREANVTSGRELLDKELKDWGRPTLDHTEQERLRSTLDTLNYKDTESMLAAIGEGAVTAAQVLRRMYPPARKSVDTAQPHSRQATGRVVVAGSADLSYALAACCKPVFPRPIIGFITRGKGVTVHKIICGNVPKEAQRLVRCSWETDADATEPIACTLTIQALNRVGLLRDLTTAISAFGINIHGIESHDNDDGRASVVTVGMETEDGSNLAAAIKKIEQLSGIMQVVRSQ